MKLQKDKLISMKLTTSLLVFWAVACSAEYSEQRVQEVHKFAKQCKEELSISSDDNVAERSLTRDDMKYMRCFYSKFNMLDANGNVIVDKVVDFMGEQYQQQVIRPVVTRCAKQDDPDVYERLWKFYQCLTNDESW